MTSTLYGYVRSVDTSPNYLWSDDNGRTWNFGGRLTSTPRVGCVAGCYKYWGNTLWMRGTYSSAQSFTTAIVGLIEEE